MAEPVHVVTHCPNGHACQVAQEDVGHQLACPVCNVHFTPTGPGTAPVAVQYAYRGLPAPVEAPRYTTWLLICWGVGEITSIAWSLYLAVWPMTPSQMGTGFGLPNLVGCFLGPAFIAAMVLQLVWNYRIHTDAARARAYNEVSPGLALGLSFVPYFNYLWTGWIVHKLARFAAEQPNVGAPQADRVVESTRWLYYCGIFRFAAALVGACIGLFRFKDMFGSGLTNTAAFMDPLAGSSMTYKVMYFLSPLLMLATLGLYLVVVPRFQRLLYAALGANVK